ncbi:MAG: glucose 1-dehydrogenase [Pseudomonadota bacterium]
MDRAVLVTGAAQGLGAAIAGRFAEEGAHVFLADINAAQGEGIANKHRATFVHLDVADEANWQNVIETIESETGRLDILVNNAGTEGDPLAAKDPEGAPKADWDLIFKVNATGVFLGCKAAMDLITRTGGGAIVNISSVASCVPTPFIAAYGASKAAVEHYSKSVALHAAEAGYQIRCNSVHPGQIRTPMLEGLFDRMAEAQGVGKEDFANAFLESIPLRAFQEPDDIANAVLFLASDEARYITGQSLVIDGGFTLKN